MAPKRKMFQVPALAGQPYNPETKRAVVTIANWAIARMRFEHTGSDGSLRNFVADQPLVDEFVFPAGVHDESDRKFGQWSDTQTVVFKWRDLVP